MNKKIVVICAIVVIITLPLFIYFTSRNNRNNKIEENNVVAVVDTDSRISDSSSIQKKDNDDYYLIGSDYQSSFVAVDDDIERTFPVLKNKIYTIRFDSKGASISSLVLNDYKDRGKDLEIIYKENYDDRAFLLYRGNDFTSPIDDVFEVESQTADSISFKRKYYFNGSEILLRKTFAISNQFMIKVSVAVESPVPLSSLNITQNIYSLEYSPFLGPVAKIDKKNSTLNTRNFYIKIGKKRKGINFSGSKKSVFAYKDDFDWFEWTGKYFTLIAVPYQKTDFDVFVHKRGDYNQSIYLSRLNNFDENALNVSDDTYFYVGPQLKNYLQKFDYAEDNDFALSDLSLSKAMEGGGALPWLQNILKYIMTIFYKWIPNWGISIILLTVLIKLLLYPLNAKSAKSAAAMQKIAPRLEEIRNEFKDDPQAMNQAIMALYRKNKINPLSSLLPMLIQLPILFAVYGLLNKHFELRGAMFIPGWIEDLSTPETVATLNFNIPVLGNQIHLLPVIYVFSMILSMLWTQRQNTAGQSKGIQKFMTYGLPAILFFSLYNVSSGLLVYWTIMNALSIAQQSYENGKLRKKASEDSDISSQKNLPPKAKKNKKNRRK